jgi:hypothetical protein
LRKFRFIYICYMCNEKNWIDRFGQRIKKGE